jgi:2-octaprenyl-6-methoxyphenol hydroxylase|tara:strand:+ start:2140 stop:3261 length:1122 start_codon:yes stop_codon:yes gene_type:complete
MKICLIGNNLTSLVLACILSKKNFYTEIYSVKSSKTNFKSRTFFKTRTLGITHHNLKYLERYFKNISKKTNSISEIKVLIKNNKINKKILFKQNSMPLFNMIKYEKLISFFKSKANSNKYISFKYLKKNSDLVLLTNKKKFQLIINCESSNILTEKFLKKEIYKNYHNKAFTTIINHTKVINNKAVQIFTEYGPIAFLPLSDKSTSVVFSFEIKKKEKISENEILNLIKQFNPSYQILSHEKVGSFNLNLRLPKKYYYKNVLFFGDSIHSIHPLAGQGFNMTIRDIIKFNEILDQKINLGLSIDKNIYKEFEKNSKSYNSIFSFGIDFIHEFFKFNKSFVPNNISEKIFTFINKNQKLKELGIKFANQGNLNH